MSMRTHLTDVTLTDRGFERIEFPDRNGNLCTLQQSSAILDDRDVSASQPGSSGLWLGPADVRMHLDRQMVVALIQRLREWLEGGRFA